MTAYAEVCDRVVVQSDDGSSREMSLSGFLEMALPMRIRFVIERRASFFLGSTQVEGREVMAQLRKAKARG